jgi:hypothetical protein
VALGYPLGTAGGFSVGAMYDKGVTTARGVRFAEICELARREAEAQLRTRLLAEGFKPEELTLHSTDSYDFTWDEVPGYGEPDV